MLYNEHRLRSGQELISENGRFKFCVQIDGNLVVYNGDKPIWASDTYQKGEAPYTLVMQHDNHLCLYDCNGTCTWSNGVQGKVSPKTSLIMQDDGNLVVYVEPECVEPLWCTRTDGGERAPDEFQGKGHALV